MIDTHDHGDDTGLALLCDHDGVVVRTIRDELELGGEGLIGRPLTGIVDEGSVTKVGHFLDRLREQEAVLGWELNVPVDDTVQTLYFGGGSLDGSLLILAATSDRQMLALYEEMMRMGNEQTNALRAAAKTQAQQEPDLTLYDEISRLNNELGVAQRELTKQNIELERLNELKNRFLGMAAHDLRNPLNAIQGYAEMLRDYADSIPQEEQRELLDIILQSSGFMADLINDLLDVTKIESGKLELDLAPVDLVALVRDNMKVNRTMAASKDIEINLDHDEALPTIVADRKKIEQVLNNLLSNAVKYSHPGSCVTVRLSHPDAAQVVMAVEDEGHGIPEDELDKLFRPFGTTTVQTTGGEKSTGLGLVIVRRIVEGHGGTIRVESEVDVGTTFYVTLPVDPHVAPDDA